MFQLFVGLKVCHLQTKCAPGFCWMKQTTKTLSLKVFSFFDRNKLTLNQVKKPHVVTVSVRKENLHNYYFGIFAHFMLKLICL